MRHSTFIALLAAAFMTSGCENHENPDVPSRRQPVSILTGNGHGQTFTYGTNGSLSQWREVTDTDSITSTYSYPDASTIGMHTVYNSNDIRVYDERIFLDAGRVTHIDGTWEVFDRSGNRIIAKAYALMITYDADNRAVSVKHSEMMGIGDDKSGKPWEWTNTVTWEGNSPVEFADYQGNSTLARTVRYNYSAIQSPTPVALPDFTYYHHFPLQMQGLFGVKPAYLMSESTTTTSMLGQTSVMRTEYDYECRDNYVDSYSRAITFDDGRCIVDTYHVDWSGR